MAGPLKTTIGQLLVNDVLPPKYRDYERQLTKKTLGKLLQQVAEEDPDKYDEITKSLDDVGLMAAQDTGTYAPDPSQLATPPEVKQARKRLQAKFEGILASGKGEDHKNAAILDMLVKAGPEIENLVYEASKKEDNPLYHQVTSGARGSKSNLKSLRGGDMLYLDARSEPIPVPILKSYSEGLSPVEYWAASFGARKGVIDLGSGTGKAGAFSKQINQAVHRLVVSADDDDDDESPDAESRGLPVAVDDPDNEGSLLARATGGLPRNTVLTPKILKSLEAKGVKKLLVRSPIVGGPLDGGIYARDAGVREHGRLPSLGEFVGLTAAQAATEPTTQMLICLHEDTPVRMADLSVKAIKDIEADEWVMGADRTGNTFPVRVIQRYDNGLRECYSTTFDDGDESLVLVSTLAHRILAREAGPNLGVIPVGYEAVVFSAKLSSLSAAGRFANREAQALVGLKPTCDLEVDHSDHLFVLANGLISSNSSKHSGGVAGAGRGLEGGFKLVENLAQVPKTSPNWATHAQEDGVVQSVIPAPQGGYYVSVGEKKHYVPEGREVQVKKGDEVDAGDVLSDGIANPAEITKHKGIGEGRRYWTKAIQDAYKGSDLTLHRRNAEVVARGLINHVELDDEIGDYSPGDVVPYNVLERSYEPREDAQDVEPKKAVGMYLEKPTLHYSIGTKIRKSMLPEFEDFGVKSLTAHANPAPFTPRMIRAAESVTHDPDWMTKLLGSYQERSLLQSAHRGAVSDVIGTSYVPAVAEAASFQRPQVANKPIKL